MTQVADIRELTPPPVEGRPRFRKGMMVLVVAVLGAAIGLGLSSLNQAEGLTPQEIASIRAEQFGLQQAGMYQSQQARAAAIAETRARRFAETQVAIWEAQR